MKSHNITSKTFGKKLGSVIRSARSMRQNLQNIILFAMEHYANTGDTGFLDRCMAACVGVSSLPTQKMKLFIQEHANVTYREVEIKEGKRKGEKIRVFKKRGKVPTYKEPTINWWEFSVAGEATPDMDVDASILNLVKKIDKKLAAKQVKDVNHAKAARKGLVKVAEDLGIVITA